MNESDAAMPSLTKLVLYSNILLYLLGNVLAEVSPVV